MSSEDKELRLTGSATVDRDPPVLKSADLLHYPNGTVIGANDILVAIADGDPKPGPAMFMGGLGEGIKFQPNPNSKGPSTLRCGELVLEGPIMIAAGVKIVVRRED